MLSGAASISAPKDIKTFAFAFYRGGVVAFRDGVEVTPSEAMMGLAGYMTRALDNGDVRASEALSQRSDGR